MENLKAKICGKEDVLKNDPEYQEMLNGIVGAIRGIKERCRQHGIFDGLRDLLECQNCGLKESVTFQGRLMTYRENDMEIDTGLRFPEPDNDGYSRCPGCGGVVRLEEEEDELSCP